MNLHHKVITTFVTILFMIGDGFALEDTLKVKGAAIPITQPGYRLFHPKWSPDGTMIAVTSDNYRGIWIMNAYGHNLTELSDDERVGYGFKWSNDSKEIACRITKIVKKRRLSAIKTISVENGIARLVTDYRALLGIPTWADKDRKICFTADDNLQIIKSERKVRQKPDKIDQNEIILYQSYGRIIITDLNQSHESILIDPDSRFLNASLSPNRKKIAFEMTNGRIYLMSIDGTHIVDLGYGSHPRWSPTGRQLVYFISRDDGQRVIDSDLFITNISGTRRIQLTNTKERIEMNPDWSPDGKTIVFDEYDTGIIYQIKIEEIHVVPPMR